MTMTATLASAGPTKGARSFQRLDLVVGEVENLAQDFTRVLPEKRRARNRAKAIR